MSGRIIPRVTKVTCVECGHEWIPRTEYPLICPRCQSHDWDGRKHLSPKQLRQQHKEAEESERQKRHEEFEELRRKLGRE